MELVRCVAIYLFCSGMVHAMDDEIAFNDAQKIPSEMKLEFSCVRKYHQYRPAMLDIAAAQTIWRAELASNDVRTSPPCQRRITMVTTEEERMNEVEGMIRWALAIMCRR